MSISKKLKAINNKIKQNKAQYHLDTQTVKISALSKLLRLLLYHQEMFANMNF